MDRRRRLPPTYYCAKTQAATGANCPQHPASIDFRCLPSCVTGWPILAAPHTLIHHFTKPKAQSKNIGTIVLVFCWKNGHSGIYSIINENHLGCRHSLPNKEGGSFARERRGGERSWQSRNAREQHYLTTIARERDGNNRVEERWQLGIMEQYHKSTFYGDLVYYCLFSAACSYCVSPSTRLSWPDTALFSLYK